MSRQRDYQPTIDRARSQAEIAKAREAKIRAKKEECHRDMLRAQNAARIANEEADALRDRILGLEQSVRDVRSHNMALRRECESAAAVIVGLRQDLKAVEQSWWRAAVERARGAFRDMLKVGAEA
jgi:uncharacterized coiled-coil DUF342 family protein